MQKIIDFLIDDEKEAISGYDKAISQITDNKVIEKLKAIRDQEVEHINILNGLKEFDNDYEEDFK